MLCFHGPLIYEAVSPVPLLPAPLMRGETVSGRNTRDGRLIANELVLRHE